MFSPASSGSVHIFTSASRALLACSVHMPGSPALSASSRSRHSSARTSPTMIRLGRIRRLSLTRSRSAISPVPSRPDCRVCIGTQSGCGNRSSKTSSADTTRSPPGIAAARQLRRVVLPAWVPPATRTFSPARTDASRNAAAAGVRLPSSTRSASRAALSTNLRMLTAVKPRLMPSRTTCSRWPSGSIASTNGRRQVDPPPARLQHPLDQLVDLGAGQHQVGQLVPAVPGHEHPGGVVDPDLLDRRVVEERLQRTEAGDPGHQLADHRRRVGHRGDRAGEAALVVVADDALGDAAYDGGVALRVDALAADDLADEQVELLDQLPVTIDGRRRHAGSPSRVRFLPGA